MIHRPVGLCQNTFGSRNEFELRSSTGLPANFVHVRPRSRLDARFCVCFLWPSPV